MEALYDWFIEPLSYQFMRRALMASVMVGVICGTLGCFIILRRMAFIGEAISHAVLPGVVIGFMIAGKGNVTLFVGAVISGLLTAMLIGFVNRNSRIKEDTAIGVIFIGFFALGVLLISRLQAVHLDLQHFLFGDPLGVAQSDLWMTAIIGVVILVSIILFYKQLTLSSFDPTMAMAIGMPIGLIHYFLMGMLSMTIVASLQAVGIVLVVAMLITPGATAYLLTDRLPRMLLLAGLFGTISAVLGLYLSVWMNYSSGSTMVVVATLIFLLMLIFAPRKGILLRVWRRRQMRKRFLQDDILKTVYQLQQNRPVASPSPEAVAAELGLPADQARSAIRRLLKSGELESTSDGQYTLTGTGRSQVYRLLRSHRLWETYLTRKAGVPWEHVHDEAEQLEHHLPEDMVDEIEERLDYPETDPHGAPIPRRDGILEEPDDLPINRLSVGDEAVITRVQDEKPEVLSRLWKMGLVPDTRFRLTGRENGTIELQVGSRTYNLDDATSSYVMARRAG